MFFFYLFQINEHLDGFQSWSSTFPFSQQLSRPRMNNQWTASCSAVTVYRNIRLGRMSHAGKNLNIKCGKKHGLGPWILLTFDSSDIKQLHVPTKWIFLLNFLCCPYHCGVMDITDTVLGEINFCYIIKFCMTYIFNLLKAAATLCTNSFNIPKLCMVLTLHLYVVYGA